MDTANGTQTGYPTRGVAWYTVFVLMLCYTLSYADRQILAFLVGPLKHDLQISDTQVGLLQGVAFAFVYSLFGLPMGGLADRFSRRNIIAIGVIVWSMTTSLCSVARSFVSLAAARMGVGIGESALSPCAFSMITDSFPKERLSSALSVYTMGIQLGSGLALVIGGLVSQAVSHMAPIAIPVAGFIPAWRVTFLIVGAPGLVVALLVLTLREPSRRALLLSSTGVAAPFGLREVVAQIRLRGRAVLGIAAMISCQATCNYALLAWGPAFFDRMHHWPKDQTGLVLGLTTLGCGCTGLFAGGWLSDRWQSRGIPDAPLRVGLISLSGILLTLVPAMLLRDAGWTVGLLVPAVFFIGLPIGCGYAALQLIFPNQARGRVSAIVIFAVALFGLVVGALLPGYLDDHLFHDEYRIGPAISLTVVLASLLGIFAGIATLAPYRAASRAMVSQDAG
jgi:MFS family permease